jgi:hypothetical protein
VDNPSRAAVLVSSLGVPDSQKEKEIPMQGQLVWHVKVRRFGHADYEIAEIRMNGQRKPKKGEIINVDIINFGVNDILVRERILAKVVSFTESTSGSRTKYTVLAAEQDNGNPPGQSEATEKDFER